jgi:hypothetical protein
VDTQFSAHNTAGDAHSAQFAAKADLVDGAVPASQLPEMNYDRPARRQMRINA